MRTRFGRKRTVRTCVIFDVDGTLVDSSTFENACYLRAIREITGLDIDDDWTRYEHVTDTGVLAEVCGRHGVSPAVTIARVRKRFGELVAEVLRDARSCAPIPGANTLFDRLRADERCAVGIATGGFAHTAKLKLERVGFDLAGVAFGCADDHHTRAGIMRHCRERLPGSKRTVYVGDGDWDAAASASLGWDFVGVGRRLEGRCAVWFADLSASPRLDRALGLCETAAGSAPP